LVDISAEFSRLIDEIETEMTAVLAERAQSAAPLYEMLEYHLGLDEPGAGGKRIRPLLGLLVYQALGGDPRKALPGAAAVELGHNFSLVHDDIEDGDVERRHRPTLWALWGVPLAINAGDALFALSRLALYRLRTPEAETEYDARRILSLMEVYDETCLALCEGQYLDITFESRIDVTVEEYLEMIGKKTASLMSAGVQAAAMLASDDDTLVESMRRFGFDLGLAFQMADDVKGSFWDSAESGKAEAGDLRRRKKTLPVIWALGHATGADLDRLRALFAPGPAGEAASGMTDAEVHEALDILERCGAREFAVGEARRYRDRAIAELEHMGIPGEAGIELAELVQRMVVA
jgi:geranylgeranyl diphosphate synthase type I